jgi:drug/metabolite transporter (DMT)-like permease
MTSEERGGLLSAIVGFAMFSAGDAVTKTMTGEWSPVAVAGLRFGIGAVVLAVMLARQEGFNAFVPQRPMLQVVRGLALGLGTSAFFTALFIMPMATAISIAFVAPALTALLSGPLLGEKVRPVTWLAITIAFIGVLVVLQPNVLAIGWAACLPLLTALGMSLLVIANRASAGQGSVLSMQFFVAFGTTIVLAVAAFGASLSGDPLFTLSWPDWTIVARCAFVATTGTTGHWLIFHGTTRAGAATVAPATYIQLITASALGWIFFDNVPGWSTLAGALIIVAAGLVLWWDGRVLASTQER